jgi:hypothetical protein
MASPRRQQAMNVIDAFKMSSNCQIEQTVGVGGHSDPNNSPLVHRAATG